MNGVNWQTVTVLVLVGAATGYLIRAFIKRRSSANHCANCPAAKGLPRR
jgi:hypothetical protein